MPCHADFQRQDPFRRLDWRWQRARHLVETDCNFCRHRDDEATGRAVVYLRALTYCTTNRQTANVQQRMPDIAQAHRLRSHGIVVNIVDARVLARQSTAEIAGRVLVDVDIIVAYEELFFDVRDRLDARSFIYLQAVANHGPCKTKQQRFAKALKQLAYYGGPLVLELVEAALFGESLPSVRTEHGTVSSLQVAKVRLLADLFTIPDDLKVDRLVAVLADLTKSTHLDGTLPVSPFTAFSEQLLSETPLELQELDLCDAAPEPVNAAAIPEDPKTRKAA